MEKKGKSNFYRGKRVLVTGGGGLIGTAFLDELLRCGARVRTVAHQRPIPFGDAVDIIDGDLREMKTAMAACRQAEVVIHAAGVSGGSKQVTLDPISMFTDSLWMNTVVIEAARKCQVQRYLFISNSSVYAASELLLKEEDAWGPTCRGIPENETGMVKRVGETQCSLYAANSDMKVAVIRTANAYGPYDNFDLTASHVVPALIRKAVERQNPFDVWGDGSAIRDFIHTSDIARAGLFILQRDPHPEPVNIGTGQVVTISQVVDIIARLVGLTSGQIRYLRQGPPASPAKRLDLDRMKSIGFSPRIDLEQGLRMTIEWYRQYGDKQR